MHSSFKSLSPDALHRIRELIEATDRPAAQIAEQVAHAINTSEASQDVAKSGFVRVTGTEMLEFVERMRRERHQVDASRRTVDATKKKSALRADQPEGLTDEYIHQQLDDWMQQQTAIQNKGAGLMSLGDIVGIVGSSVTALATWVRAERVNYSPNLPDIKKLVRAVRGDVEAAFKAA